MSSPWLFMTRDPQGREVGLRRRTFEDHISDRHPGVTPDLIRATIEGPERILENPDQESINYVAVVLDPSGRRLYRLVGAKKNRERRSPEWSVATAFPRALPPTVGRTVWMRTSAP